MAKLLIVDDDVIIRRGLSQSILWEENGIELAGTAPDGEVGLEFVEKERPDIIVSDIKMPFMDGLEFTRAVKSRYPETKVILLTGYEEFELAKEALKLKAFEFIMKPVDKDQLLEVVKGAVWELENEKKIKRQVAESIPLLRQRFLLRLIGGICRAEEIQPELDLLKIPLVSGNVLSMSIKADDYYNPDYHREVMEKELLKFCIKNICEEVLPGQNSCAMVDQGTDEMVLLYTDSRLDSTIFQGEAFRLAEDIRNKVEKYLRTTVTIGLGSVYSDLADACKSYNEACAAVEFRHILGKNQVLSVMDTGLPVYHNSVDFSALERELAQKVKLGLHEEAYSIVDMIEDRLTSLRCVSLDYTRLLGIEIIVILLKEAEGWPDASDMNESSSRFYSLSNEVQALQTVHEIMEKLKALIDEICAFIDAKREKQQKVIVKQAMEFIKQNYEKEDLSLQGVSDEVHVSPSYLSRIFKKEKSINFSDFLSETRIKKAMELIRSTDLKTYEVAEMVGYSNTQYFSVCFKKYTGFSPSEFKKC